MHTDNIQHHAFDFQTHLCRLGNGTRSPMACVPPCGWVVQCTTQNNMIKNYANFHSVKY